VHAILDGRDTPPKSAEKYLEELLAFIKDKRNVHLSTIIGRYFTMDRDKRWDRVQRGYDLMTLGVGTETKHPIETLRRFYEQGVTDEFMEPISDRTQKSPRRSALASRSETTAHRRNREIRARHIFLQRRFRQAVARRRSRADSVAENRDVRQEAGDVVARARRSRGTGDRQTQLW